MPYIPAADYEMVRHIIAPGRPQNDTELQALETSIYALNREIRALPGSGPSPQWSALMETHARLLGVYHAAGGKRL